MYGLNKTMTCLDIANTDIKHNEDSISLLDINDDSLLDIESSRHEAYEAQSLRGTSRGKEAEEQMDTTDTRHKAYEAEKETCGESSEADR